MAGLGKDPVMGKVLGAIFGSSLNTTWDPRVYQYYSKNADAIFGQSAGNPNYDLQGATIKMMQADPTQAHLFEVPKTTASATAGGQQVPQVDAAAQAAANAKALATANSASNSAQDLAGENKNLTIAGGSADAAATSVDESGLKKRASGSLAATLGINV